jgi:signal transduction histidine kinase
MQAFWRKSAFQTRQTAATPRGHPRGATIALFVCAVTCSASAIHFADIPASCGYAVPHAADAVIDELFQLLASIIVAGLFYVFLSRRHHGRDEQRLEPIRRLAAGVAHDFNNILQAVSGGLELMLDELPPQDPITELALIAQKAAQRGTQVTQNLLAYARRQVLMPEPIDLRQWLPEMQPELQAAIGPKKRLLTIFGCGPVIVLADADALRNAWLHLARNAGRAMTDGGELLIEMDHCRNPNGFVQSVQLRFSDTGSGMDTPTLARCLEPFFTTQAPTGTGLGLSMVQGFAIQSGGSLDVSSRPGKGTTVTLKLPAYIPRPMQHGGPLEPHPQPALVVSGH